jgi:tetratricopeptide (TPR) repeat protein
MLTVGLVPCVTRDILQARHGQRMMNAFHEGPAMPSRWAQRAALTVIFLTAFGPAIAMESSSSSSTVIGSNVLLVEGANALSSGEWKRGIQLTELGLASAVSQDDRAAALANLCAGYAALKDFDKALRLCDSSLDLQDRNWRTWQNRAACHLGLGKIEESLRDVQRGLELNPDSESLQQTLDIIRQHEQRQQERLQQLLES